MLSRIVCKIVSQCWSPRKHAGFAKFACFRSDLAQFP